MKLLYRKTVDWARQTWVWTLLLVSWVALMVWFVGPLVAVNDYRFWASTTARLLSIIVLVLGWGLGMVFFNGRGKSSASLGGNDTCEVSQARVESERREVRSRFKKALRALRSSSLYPGRSGRWRNDLPWYLLMGPPASGKTSLLRSCGHELSQGGFDQQTHDSLPATRQCDWFFAGHAVLVDTAGRYLTQADNDVDNSAWAALLELMRKRRRRRPLSGVLMTVPIDLLLSGSESEVDALARQIRGRLQELRRRLHTDVPTYLILSKADRVPGFNEFFDSLTREENNQVLGASFNRDQRGCDVSLLRSEFEALLQRLNGQVITRMQQERDSLRRGSILDFPHRLGQIGAHLCLLAEQGFTGSGCTLRGFYLTCVPSSSLVPDSVGGQTRANARAAPGRPGRFVHHLFSRVIFPEADLADLDQRGRRRLYWGQSALYFAGLAIPGLFGLLWTQGFAVNHERLENLRLLAQRWDQLQSVQKNTGDWAAMLDSLDTRFEATQVFPPVRTVPLYERVGLYQGEASDAVLDDAYRHALQTQLLPRVAKRLEEHIRSNRDEREHLLVSLRAYLMLGMKERRDSAWLMERMATDWSLRYPADAARQQRLNAHFARLLEQPFIHALDEPLVAQARERLRGESMAVVVYRMLRDQASHLPPYRLSHHLGAQGTLLVGTDHVIPGFYTRQGYEQFFSIRGATLIPRLLQDNWVLGDGEGLSDMDMRRLMAELEQLYFRDYSDRWSEAVGQVAVQTITRAGQGAEQLAGLASAHSPIVQMLVQVRENTRITTVAEHFDTLAPATEEGGHPVARLAAVAGNVAGSLKESLPDTARKSLQRRFESLHRLLGPDNAPTADLNHALRALDEVQLQLASLARAGAPDHAAFELARNRMGGQQDALSHLRAATARLPRPVAAWFSAVAEDSWRLVLDDSYRYLNQRYQNELYSFYAKAINKRYPFNAHSASDVALNDFREFFRDQGVADRFFESYIRPFVNDSAGQYCLRSVDGQGLPLSRAYLDQMAAARTIRRSFFAQDPAEPQVQFTLEPYTLDPTVSRSEFRFGDRTLEYRHGPILPMAFTWPSAAQDGRTALVLEKTVGRGVGIEKNTGPWSLFRLFDLMQTEDLSGRDVRLLKADLGGLRANYLLTSQRTPNPFDMNVLRTFRMPVQL
ncbi:type VI secretion system membrane subunit TssM [Pseudomonas sp. SMN5]|uniref:type VI secretion system membrane subunit TssM n=1 Tax=Pseudomonas sp. SMN5 TaxID=3390198 RepID=UPI003F84D752